MLWKIHNWMGLYAGIVIGILSITGAAAVFIPEIDRLINKNLYKVTPSDSKSAVNTAIQQALTRFADYRLLGIRLPEEKDEAYILDLQGGKNADIRRVYVYVDPYQGTIIGQSNGQNSIANFMRQIHVRLYDTFYGRQIVGLAGIALALSCITGLLIYGDFMRRQLFGAIRNGRGLRIVMADWHKLVGIAALLFNLVIALTGAWLGLQPRLMDWLSMEVPNRYVPEIITGEAEDRALVPEIEEVLLLASREFPDLEPARILLSSDGSRTVEVHGDIKGGVYERHSSKLIMDKATGEIFFKYDVREQSFGEKLYFVQEALHFGDFGGTGLKIIYCLLGLSTGFLSITGFIVYLKRREKNKTLPSATMKTVFVYSVSILLGLIMIGFLTLSLGYQPTTRIITPLVYIFLGGLLLYFTLRYFGNIIKRNTGKVN